ncbi:MAG: sulfite exporter TauE/SafE family protein [Candidatus Bathyarchaeota archaeon]|nr:sulfite exporter TauE/SafE family protein [Candidatus Bathyarchaeota archaeon]
MSLMPGIPNPYLESFAVGLLYGLVFCTSACLPYIASYIAGIGAGFRKGITVTLIYNSGRITAYALIGGLVGAFSGIFRLFVSDATMSPFQEYSSYAFSIVTILIGISIILKNKSKSCDCNMENNEDVKASTFKRFDVRAFSLGLSRGLIICPPLVMLLLYSMPFAAPFDTFAVAVLFGIGTAVSPLLLLGGVTGWLLNKAPLFREWISIAGAAILILLGAGTLVNTIIVAYS